MNIHTERLEDHTARFTVEIEPERLDEAKRKAARKIAKQVRIPGFRQGKAPYNILVQYGFEPNILNDAIDSLTQVIYKETLDQAEDIEPYGPGNLEDVKLEEKPVFIYTVPLQPIVELNNYRDVRLDYTAPEVTDEMVDDALRRLQQEEALVEESQHPVAVGNRITVDIHSEFIDDAPNVDASTEGKDEDKEESNASDDDDVEASAETEHDHEHHHEHDHDHDHEKSDVPAKGDDFIHEHDTVLNLDPENEPILPGFIDALVGSNVGEDVTFELTVPIDNPDYENYSDIAGRRVKFDVSLKKVENVTLPELNDDFAARITKDEDEPLTLLQLRIQMRENLQTEAENRAKSAYGREVLDKMVEQAKISYPEAMISAQSEGMVEDFERSLRQQGISMDVYTKVTGQGKEEIQANYREPAIRTIERSLVMREVLDAEKVRVSDSAIDKRIDLIVSQYGEQAGVFRSIFDTPHMRSNIYDELLNQKVMDVIVAIGMGEDPATVLAEPEEEIVEDAVEMVETVENEIATNSIESVDAPSEEVETEASVVEVSDVIAEEDSTPTDDSVDNGETNTNEDAN